MLMEETHQALAFKIIYNVFLTFSCGSGSYYGTLSGPVEAMSPLLVPRKAYRSPGRNIITLPPKRGSGYRFSKYKISKTII